MNQVFDSLMPFFAYSVLAIGAQNVIFSRGLGLSTGLRMINDPKKDTVYFCVALTFFQIINSVLAYFTVPLIYKSPLAEYARFATPVVIVVCCAVSYIVVVFALGAILKKIYLQENYPFPYRCQHQQCNCGYYHSFSGTWLQSD